VCVLLGANVRVCKRVVPYTRDLSPVFVIWRIGPWHPLQVPWPERYPPRERVGDNTLEKLLGITCFRHCVFRMQAGVLRPGLTRNPSNGTRGRSWCPRCGVWARVVQKCRQALAGCRVKQRCLSGVYICEFCSCATSVIDSRQVCCGPFHIWPLAVLLLRCIGFCTSLWSCSPLPVVLFLTPNLLTPLYYYFSSHIDQLLPISVYLYRVSGLCLLSLSLMVPVVRSKVVLCFPGCILSIPRTLPMCFSYMSANCEEQKPDTILFHLAAHETGLGLSLL